VEKVQLFLILKCINIYFMKRLKKTVEEWKKSDVHVFWGEIAPCDHVLQIYESEKMFVSTLVDFACHGFKSGDGVIVIATPEHLEAVKKEIVKKGYNIDALIKSNQFVPAEASELLSRFMIRGWPDETLFHDSIMQLIEKASENKRKVRAFGEMVAVLWAQGLNGATVQLEMLWCQLHEKENISLYCAYPKSGFTQTLQESVDSICRKHSHLLDGTFRTSPDIYYRNI
jgi:hypothetical protein